MKILFLGGDRRMITAYNILKNEHEVSSLGLFPNDDGNISAADAIVLPVPATRDGDTVNCPLTNKKIPLRLLDTLTRGTHIITYGHKFSHYPQTDYSSLDDFCIKNAVLTAEGAIAYAIDSTERAIFKSRILIVGFGRVGKALFSRLMGFGADITVSARKPHDLALAESLGANTVKTEYVAEKAHDYDIIFNTADLPIFEDPATLGKALLIDLSTSGCIDLAAAEKFGIKAVKLPSVPAKTAPVSAGEIIADTVSKILTENQKY